MQQGGYDERIERAAELLRTTRHMAIATLNADGSPHNTPVFFAFDDMLHFYWASGQDTRHSQNIARDSRVFMTLFNSQERGGGLYIQATAQALSGDELVAGLQAVNARRHSLGRPAVPRALYQGRSPQRLYKATPTMLWVNVTEYTPDGEPLHEYRKEITAQILKDKL